MSTDRLTGAVVAGALAFLVGCAGHLEHPELYGDGGEALINCPDVPATILSGSCAATCHSAATRSGMLDLASPGLAARLLGVPATGGPGLLIDPVTPSRSVLYTKLTATPPYLERMPLGNPIDPVSIICVRRWVAEEAATARPPATDGGSPSGDGGGKL